MNDQSERPVAAAAQRWNKLRYSLAALQRDVRDPDPDHERKQWEAVHDALVAYCRPGNDERFPVEMAFALAEALEWILAGAIPWTWAVIPEKMPKHRPVPPQSRARAAAVLYVRAARARLVDDPHPIAKLAGKDWFNVARRSIERWLLLPEYEGVDPAHYLEDWPTDARREAIIAGARKGAEIWRVLRKHRDWRKHRRERKNDRARRRSIA